MALNKEQEQLLEELVHVRSIVKRDSKRYGICYYVTNYERLDSMFRRWPQFSGIVPFPVPCAELGAKAAFDKALEEGTFWDASTTYGRKRHELLAWLIEELENGRC